MVQGLSWRDGPTRHAGAEVDLVAPVLYVHHCSLYTHTVQGEVPPNCTVHTLCFSFRFSLGLMNVFLCGSPP